MRRVSAFLALPALAACATPGMPTRAQVGSAIIQEQICLDRDGLTNCHPPPSRAVFRRLSCVPAADPDHPARILCRYAGHLLDINGQQRAIGHDCAYFTPVGDGGWRLDSFPDHDMCGER
jgi:hypothetical protein